MDFLFYFKTFLGKWQFLVQFNLKNHARVVEFSYSNFAPLKVYIKK